MTDYTELVKALRCCMVAENSVTICDMVKCPYSGKGIDCENELYADAAAAIEALEDELADENSECDYLVNENARLTTENNELKAAIKRLEPKRGEWIYDTAVYGTTTGGLTVEHHYTCSVCGALMGRKGDAYCYKCGAKMDGERKEERE